MEKINSEQLFYHYTSIETFYKMLEESLRVNTEKDQLQLLIRATHSDFLNDQTEGKLFKACLLRDLKIYANKHKHELTEEELSNFDALYDVKDAFVTSFSTLGDSLDMWRAYGGNGKGVCLGFDFSPTDPYADNDGKLYFAETINLVECKPFLPEEIIDDSIVAEIYDRLINVELDSITRAGHLANGVRYGLKYKHRAYWSEHEYRLIHTRLHTDKDIKFLEGSLKPYIEYPIDIKRLKKIVLGPCLNPDEMKTKLTTIMRYKGLLEVDVEKSEIPYRG